MNLLKKRRHATLKIARLRQGWYRMPKAAPVFVSLFGIWRSESL